MFGRRCILYFDIRSFAMEYLKFAGSIMTLVGIFIIAVLVFYLYNRLLKISTILEDKELKTWQKMLFFSTTIIFFFMSLTIASNVVFLFLSSIVLFAIRLFSKERYEIITQFLKQRGILKGLIIWSIFMSVLNLVFNLLIEW